MKPCSLSLRILTLFLVSLAATVPWRAIVAADIASPIFGIAIPDGYRQWELVAPALEGEPMNELSVGLGNSVAMTAYRAASLPFPDGTILVRLAWKRAQSPEFEPASVPGAVATIQVLIKDSTKYSATGGWGFARFVNG